MEEVDVQPVDLSHELRQRVQLGLDLAPVVVRRPGAGELLHGRERHALGVIVDRLPLGPPGRLDAPAQLDQILVGEADLEGTDRGGRLVFGRDRHAGLLGGVVWWSTQRACAVVPSNPEDLGRHKHWFPGCRSAHAPPVGPTCRHPNRMNRRAGAWQVPFRPEMPGRADCPALETGGRWTPWHATRPPGGKRRSQRSRPCIKPAEHAQPMTGLVGGALAAGGRACQHRGPDPSTLGAWENEAPTTRPPAARIRQAVRSVPRFSRGSRGRHRPLWTR
jgi:hypothetical protein